MTQCLLSPSCAEGNSRWTIRASANKLAAAKYSIPCLLLRCSWLFLLKDEDAILILNRKTSLTRKTDFRVQNQSYFLMPKWEWRNPDVVIRKGQTLRSIEMTSTSNRLSGNTVNRCCITVLVGSYNSYWVRFRRFYFKFWLFSGSIFVNVKLIDCLRCVKSFNFLWISEWSRRLLLWRNAVLVGSYNSYWITSVSLGSWGRFLRWIWS